MGTGHKGPDRHGDEGASNKMEENMTGLYTASELQTYSLDQLYGLYRRIERELFESAPASVQRRIALANLENIARAICLRYAFHHQLRRNIARPNGPRF